MRRSAISCWCSLLAAYAGDDAARRMPATSAPRIFCVIGLRSLLSRSKYTGFSGEFLFRSSSEADEIASSRTGSGGTTVGSATGSGGVGRREGAVVAVVVGGGAGRATGGAFLWHAAA